MVGEQGRGNLQYNIYGYDTNRLPLREVTIGIEVSEDRIAPIATYSRYRELVKCPLVAPSIYEFARIALSMGLPVQLYCSQDCLRTCLLIRDSHVHYLPARFYTRDIRIPIALCGMRLALYYKQSAEIPIDPSLARTTLRRGIDPCSWAPIRNMLMDPIATDTCEVIT